MVLARLDQACQADDGSVATRVLLAQIGERLGVSRQPVQRALALQGKLRVVPIPCPQCGMCPREATFGQRLKTRRMSAGRCGVGRMLLSSYASADGASTIRVLSVDWLAVK